VTIIIDPVMDDDGSKVQYWKSQMWRYLS